eukprot:7796697-Ditylum_brightwellii.AAC.1
MALQYYAKDLPEDFQESIKPGMGIVQSGTKKTLIQFHRKYYIYNGAKGSDKVADEGVVLVIEEYKLALLVDIVTSYGFEMTEKCFKESRYR